MSIIFRVRVTLRLAVYRQSVHLGSSPLETHDQYFQLNTCGYSLCNILCGERMGLSSTIAGPRQRSHFRVRVPRTHDHILLSQIRDSSNLEGQVPVFISPRNNVAQLCPQAIGSLFVFSYDSQGYGGGIRTCLHTGLSYYLQLAWGPRYIASGWTEQQLVYCCRRFSDSLPRNGRLLIRLLYRNGCTRYSILIRL
jgi:hypothetical protein